MTEMELSPQERTFNYCLGIEIYQAGNPEPHPDAEYQTPDYYINAGWRRAQLEESERNAKEELEAGLDYESLDKLSKQLKALGFTIPNE